MSNPNDTSVGTTIVVIALLLVFFLYTCFQAQDLETPARVLQNQGYTGIQVRSGSALGIGCAGDEIAYDATALNTRGERVRLTVCCGTWLKSCTVRSR